MKIGYVRVSTLEQNEARQLKKMNEANVDKIFLEKISAKNISDRPQLKKMLRILKSGDLLYIHDFSRLARSTKDLLEIVDYLSLKNITLISFKENIDTSTPAGKLMLTMIGAVNEFERLNLLERQKEGIFIAKEQGKYTGRKPIPLPRNWEKVYLALERNQITNLQAQKLLNLKRSTFYNFLKSWRNKNSITRNS